MKILRLLYMIAASIALLPLILVVSIGWLVFITYLCYKIDEVDKAFTVWWDYIRTGIIMNMDFIKNGL